MPQIAGTPGDDTIRTGAAGGSTVGVANATDLADRIIPGPGRDAAYAGDGDDEIVLDSAGDVAGAEVVNGESGWGTLFPGATGSTTVYDLTSGQLGSVEELTIEGPGLTISGSPPDTILLDTVSSGVCTLAGGANDVIVLPGTLSNDQLVECPVPSSFTLYQVHCASYTDAMTRSTTARLATTDWLWGAAPASMPATTPPVLAPTCSTRAPGQPRVPVNSSSLLKTC